VGLKDTATVQVALGARFVLLHPSLASANCGDATAESI
jgi:hypothetical protein